MKALREDPHRALILGGGRGGMAVLNMLLQEDLVDVVGVADRDPFAPAMEEARRHGIPTYDNIEDAVRACAPCVAFNLTGNEMVEDVAAGILGAGGVIGGLEARLILQIVNRLREAKDRLRFEATHDMLTGLCNRRYMMELLRDGIAQALRYDFPYSVVLLDLDHFKKINDTHGHAAGDAVLQHVSKTIRKNIRSADTMGRWGGEEFLVLLPHTGGEQAAVAARNWLEAVRRYPVELPGGATITVSFSAGVASLAEVDHAGETDEIVTRLLHLADVRLYAAKENGRGCVKSA